MTVGSLFSGVGGLDLGLHRAGMETEWFCEIEPFAQEVLKRHWPDKAIISDIRDINEEAIAEGLISPVDIIAGGFPCQDISWAGRGRGIDYDLSEQEGSRSGLWWEMWRVIRLLRPRYVIAENVPALTHRGLDIVLGSLAQIGYDAEWQTISAAAVGAPHIRERVFIVGYRQDAVGDSISVGLQGNARGRTGAQSANGHAQEQSGYVADSNHPRLEGRGGNAERGGQRPIGEGGGHSWFGGLWPQPWPVSFKRGKDELERVAPVGDVRGVADGLSGGMEQEGVMWRTPDAGLWNDGESVESYMARKEKWKHKFTNTPPLAIQAKAVALGDEQTAPAYICTDVPDRTGRLKGLGNAVVPQVGYLVGRAVMEHAKERQSR